MRTIAEITDNELLAIEGLNDVEYVRNILARPEAIDHNNLVSSEFGILYAQGLEANIPYERGTEEWDNADTNNLLVGQVIAQDINRLLLSEPKLIVWKITPQTERAIEDIQYWKNQDVTIGLSTRFTSGSAYISTVDDVPPLVDLDNDEGVNVLALGERYGSELHGPWSKSWIWNNIPEEYKSAIEAGFDERSYQYMEQAGWDATNNETWFYGPLTLEKVTQTL